MCILLLALLLCGCSPIPQPTVPTDAAPTFPTEPNTKPSTEPATEPITEPTQPVPTKAPDPIETLLESMTTEELVGQLFLARCPANNAVEDITRYHLGGYILFGRDFQGQTPDSLTKKLAAYQSASAIPMLIAVDEEGGTVVRASRNSAFRSSPFPSPRNLFHEGGIERVLEIENKKCALLSSLGICVNMAPVCDVTTDSQAFMYARSLGQSPEVTGHYVAQVVKAMRSNRIGSVLKHFPGYGNNTDTHTGIAIDDRSLNELKSVDLIPFASGIAAGCDAILVSHTIVRCLDADAPASLSPAVHRYLREEMHFEGVIVTDDLVMQAITDQYGSGEAAVLAVLAGNDLLCVTDYAVQYQAVLDAVNSGRISRSMLLSAVSRILRWKTNIGLMG